jgi:hypothetical protein
MRYWSWPPYGVGWYDDWYDWPNMPDSISSSSPQVQIDAVARLSHEVGEAAAMSYGCTSSTAWLGSKPGKDMTEAYREDFRYNENTDFEQRWHHSDEWWFNTVTTNLNANQPLQYGFLDLSIGDGFAAHSTVLDGWKTVGNTRMVHMNYGWSDTGTDTWYNLNDLPGGAEGFIRKIRPKPSLGQTVSGWYSPSSFPYRYFNRDAMGSDAHFDAGQYLQFLPGVKVVCTGTLIEFRGWSNANTYLYTTASWAQGIRINSGHIYLYQNGGLRLY